MPVPPVHNDPHGTFASNPPTNNGLEHGQAYNTHDGNLPNDNPSTIGEQLVTEKVKKSALVEAKKHIYFGQLASTEYMPKHMGKTIKGYVWLPLLHDANINDQGIDAQGLRETIEATIVISTPGVSGYLGTDHYVVGEGIDAASATTAVQASAVELFKRIGVFNTDYDTTKADLEGAAEPWTIEDSHVAVPNTGNLYGSSKDIGYISARLPLVGEHGGRVNRVGFSRKTIKGTMERYGMYEEATKDSHDFDSEADLVMHKSRELMRGAAQMAETQLQIDLISHAGIIMYAGAATSTDTLNGEIATATVATYTDFVKMSIMQDRNLTPTQTTIIKGSRMNDTRVVDSGRIMYIGSELTPLVESLQNNYGNPAFISREHYADSTSLVRGEIGSVYRYRISVVPDMTYWAGAGADATADNAGFATTNDKYDVFPMLTVGDGAFTTIGFQSSGKNVKFDIIHKKAGKENANRLDPYGMYGFTSLTYWYGFMPIRPERIGLIKTVGAF